MPFRSKKRIALVGFPVIPEPGDQSLLNGLLRYANERGGWQYVFSAEGTADAMRGLLKMQFDGAVVRLITPEMTRLAKRASVPIVNVSTWLRNPALPTVCRDDEMIGRFAAEHLLQRGFRRFACVLCPGGWFVRARAEGFRRVIEKAGFPCEFHTMKPHINQISQPQQTTVHDLRELESWLAQIVMPTGLFWTEDHLGEHLLLSCQRIGIRVPRDMAVVSAPNRIERCVACVPPLSSVNSREEETGHLAARWLDRLMAGEEMPQSPQTVPPSHVEMRKSSDTFAAEHPIVAQAVQFIYEHITEGINSSEVIGRLDFPRRTFYRLFEEATGRTPQDFIQKRRVDVTLDLLTREKDLGLHDIARLCGFRDRNRMNAVIEKATGRKPQEWREESPIAAADAPSKEKPTAKRKRVGTKNDPPDTE